MARLTGSLSAFAVLVSVTTLASATPYDEPGPLGVKTVSVTPAGNATQIAYPDGPGPYPLLVLGHGFSSSPDNQIGWGKHFASYGFIAIAPTLCTGFFCAPDPTKATALVQAAIAYMEGPDAPADVLGKVDAAHVGLEGHSAGGQAWAVAAAALHPQAVVLFDPVGGTGMTSTDAKPGSDAVPQICSPLLTLFAESQAGAMSCNKNGNWKPFGMSSSGPRAVATVTGATHCDGENVAMGTCGLVCGGNADAARQARFAHYATAWFLARLKDDPDANAALALAQFQADPTVHDADQADGSACDAGSGGAGGSSPAGAGGSGVGGDPGVGGGTGMAGNATGTGGDVTGAGGESTGAGGQEGLGAGGGGAGAGGSTAAMGGSSTTQGGGGMPGGSGGATGSSGTGGGHASAGGPSVGAGGGSSLGGGATAGASGKQGGAAGSATSAGDTGGSASDSASPASDGSASSSGGCGVSARDTGAGGVLLLLAMAGASVRRRRSS